MYTPQHLATDWQRAFALPRLAISALVAELDQLLLRPSMPKTPFQDLGPGQSL